MDFQGYKKRYQHAIEKNFNFPREHASPTATPKQYLNDTKKYLQSKPRRAYSTKHRNYLINSQKYEGDIIEDLKNRKNLIFKENFSFDRIKTPTFFSSINISHKIEIAHKLILKNNIKIEEVNNKLTKLLDLYDL